MDNSSRLNTLDLFTEMRKSRRVAHCGIHWGEEMDGFVF